MPALHRILFVCVANSARSQLAEAIARHRLPGLTFQSAGSEPSRVNPYALKVLEERGIDAEGLHSKHVDTIAQDSVDVLVALCAEESCPVAFTDRPRVSWEQPDPDRKEQDLTDEERLQIFRDTADSIELWVERLQQGVLYFTPSDDAELCLRTDGLVQIHYPARTVMDVDRARRELRVMVDSIQQSNWPAPTGLIVFLEGVSRVSREAREHYAGRDLTGVYRKIALVGVNPIARVLGNFFLKLQSPLTATRLFATEAEAVAWLI